MDFDALVKYIKAQGCRVTVYRKKERVGGSYGEFAEDPSPRINLATLNHPKSLVVSVLLHEYAHFLQYREGFSKYIDGICFSYDVHYDWLNGKIELTETERMMARNAMLAIEYDAEMRAYDLGKELGVEDFDPELHLRDAASYMAHLKWSWLRRLEWDTRLNNSHWPAKKLTHDELFAPLDAKENHLFKKLKAQKGRRRC